MILQVQRREGVAVVEAAVVFPAFFLLLIGLIVASLGVFRYQEVASLSREAARWASVRGFQYQQSTGNWAATKQDVYDEVIKPRAKLLQLENLTYDVTWDPHNRQDGYVTVTITYRWIPEVFFGGVDLTSTTTMPMAY